MRPKKDKNYELRSYFNRGSIRNNTFQEKTAYQTKSNLQPLFNIFIARYVVLRIH